MDQKNLKELEGIDNVRQWMLACCPTEWQTPRIPHSLTFTWLMNHIHETGKWGPKLDLDTAPREAILTEAVRRLLVRILASGYCRWAVAEMLNAISLCPDKKE